MKNKTVVLLKRSSLTLLVMLIIFAITEMTYSAIRISKIRYTSFPWTMAYILGAMYYIPPILIVLCVYLYFRNKGKKIG